MPSTMYVPITSHRIAMAAISTHGCEGRAMVCHRPAVQQLDPDQSIGDRKLQPGDFDALAGEPVRPGIDPSPLDEGIREFLDHGLLATP